MNEKELKDIILNAMHNSVKGELFKELRGITIDWDQNKLKMIAYVGGDITEEIEEHINDIDTYFLSHMPEDFKSEVKIIRCDKPNTMSSLKEWVYRRVE